MVVGHRQLAAIMFTDMVGFSALTQVDESTALGVLDRHNRLLRPVFARFRGREVKAVGDAFLVEFESALEAVQCALEIQRVLHDYNSSSPIEWRIRIRIGIHVGDVVRADGDVLGDTVNIASRIEPMAEPEGICISQQVFDQVQNKVSTPLIKLPPRELKNIHVPVVVYRIVQPWENFGAAPASPSVTVGRHLAVLPLANISPDPHDDYFADGLTEELISALSQVRDLNVIARTSVMGYKTAPRSIAQVGVDLGVDTVLEGSVRKSGNRIRISLQLINVATQGHIWASSYNREVDDVFTVQADIANRTAQAMRLELAPKEPSGARRRPAPDPGAYDLYLKALAAAMEPDGSGIDPAVHLLERATEIDPTFAEAYAAWANTYVVAAGDYLPMREVMPRARSLVARALELEPDSSDAHSALANIAFQFDHDWDLAEREFNRALELNPSNATAHRFFGSMLLARGRLEEAREEVRRLVRIDPAGPGGGLLAMIELAAGNYDAAFEYSRQQSRIAPFSLAPHVYLGLWYLKAGRREDALREADFPLPDSSDVVRFDHALLDALLGRPDTARIVAGEAERGESKSYTSATHLAMLYAALGQSSRALDLLEQDYREGDRVLWTFYRGAWFDSIRNDPRFVALLREYGLPTQVPLARTG
jgi:adenylate cyclase